MVAAIVVALIYLVALLAEFVAPFSADAMQPQSAFAPPQTLKFVRSDNRGTHIQLHVLGYRSHVDPESFKRVFATDSNDVIAVGFFVKGEPYRLLGIFPAERHLIGPIEPGRPMFLSGADRMGRDVLSRTIYGARVSLSIGLVGVFSSLILGILIGGWSGLAGGIIDLIIQRLIEFLRSIPLIPLWMGLAAAVPQTWSSLRVYFAITLLLSLVGWTGLAREVRAKFIAMKNEDFVIAARLDGAGETNIIFKHMVPSFLSHIIANVTLAIPAMILTETALSFVGVGLRAPAVSWGVLLQDAQNIRAVTNAPWLFLPGAGVVVAVLSMNFLGDGLIDAADPYSER